MSTVVDINVLGVNIVNIELVFIIMYSNCIYETYFMIKHLSRALFRGGGGSIPSGGGMPKSVSRTKDLFQL